MKKQIFAAALLLSAVSSFGAKAQSTDPVGTLSYSLPQTTIVLDVEAQKHHFFAGPYAKFSQKYLGIDAKTEDEVTYEVVSVVLTPYLEADQSQRYLVTPGKDGAPSFLQLSAQGLVSVADGNFGASSAWRFPKQATGDYSDKGVSSNLTSISTTLYKTVTNEDGSVEKVPVQQSVIVEKSLEDKAKEAAELIFDLREKRVQIVTGDTDATYSGEAMAAALAEISRLEKEYMSMFIGYSETQVQKMKFDVIPSADNKTQVYVAFRISDTDGLVASDNMSGKPYLLELVPQKVTAPQNNAAPSKAAQVAYYRIPATCSVKLSDGMNILLQDRITVYQLGVTSSFVLSK